MRMLNVALITKGNERAVARDYRPLGWWSYQLPEFVWSHIRVGRGTTVNVGQLADRLGFDLFVTEDWSGPVFYANRTVPVVFVSYDDTLTRSHLDGRVRQAARCDMVLVDHGPLAPFKRPGIRVVRLAHAVNDHLFKPVQEKLVDVAFHCSTGHGVPGGEERADLRHWLGDTCKRLGLSYRSGVVPIEEYARSLAEARVVVNLPRLPTNRPHRVLDAMACRSALLTAPIPDVDGDGLVVSKHHQVWQDKWQLEEWLKSLVKAGWWETFATNGYEHVMKNHTWSVRAKQFRAVLNKEFGL